MNSSDFSFSETGLDSSRLLLSWWDENRRILPWREDPTPYHVWVSEIMLQQTRVEAVIGYYQRFLAELPDVESLAAASEEQCLKLWEGLGYYSRVRNMHRAAEEICSGLGGRMPSTFAGLKALPGIGEYTAAAIASIAFGEPVPAIDGNLLRVHARLTESPLDIKKAAGRSAARSYYLARIPSDRPGDYNQALMDLGASVCLPNGAPRCLDCPWKNICLAHAHGTELKFPAASRPAPRRAEDRTVLVVRGHVRAGMTAVKPESPQFTDTAAASPICDEYVLLRHRPPEGLLAGMFEFPNLVGTLTEAEACQWVESLGFHVGSIQKTAPAKHIFSHIEWHMTGYQIIVDGWNAGRRAADALSADRQEAGGWAADWQAAITQSADAEVSADASDIADSESSSGARLLWVPVSDISRIYAIPSAYKKFLQLLG